MDILKFNLKDLEFDRFTVFGNLPYNISSQILVKFINFYDDTSNYKKIIFMFQKEVGQKIIANFKNAIINIHPALLPKFGGKGMYGLNVHKAVLESNDSFSGITIHYVNSEYDKGKIIFQAKCGILKNDTPKLLAKRIQKLEHQFYPIKIEKILQNDN